MKQYEPIKTGPASSGSQTSLEVTILPFGKITSSPPFSLPNSGPGGTPIRTHLSKFKAPGLGCNRQIYDMEMPFSFVFCRICWEFMETRLGVTRLPLSRIKKNV